MILFMPRGQIIQKTKTNKNLMIRWILLQITIKGLVLDLSDKNAGVTVTITALITHWLPVFTL